MNQCPSCNKNTISNIQVMYANNLFPAKCSFCKALVVINSLWANYFTLFGVITFVVSVALSISQKTYLPYLLIPLYFLVTRFILILKKPLSKTKNTASSSLLYFAMLAIFAIVLLKFV